MERWRQALDGGDFGEREERGTGDSKSVDSFIRSFAVEGKKRKGGVDEEECGLKGGCF